MTKMHPCMVFLRVLIAITLLLSTHFQRSTYTVDGLTPNNLDLFKLVTNYMFGNTAIKMGKLLQEYSTICPVTEQCDLQHIPPEDRPGHDNHPMLPSRDCPACDCHFTCIANNNCCLGSYFGYLRFGWTDSIVCRSSRSNISAHAVAMISVCPIDYEGDMDVVDKCMGRSNASEMFIHSSSTSQLTYRNRYCAECHNDTDLTPWIPKLFCDDKHTVDNLYTYTRNELDEKNCYIQFTGPFEIPLTARPKTYNIDKCNITGLWKQLDPDIIWACENLIQQYRDFKNVFCYICNPSIASTRSTSIIDRCNTTGAWSKFDAEEAHACATQNQTERLSPYKNVYCLICNGLNNTAIPNEFGLSFFETLYTNRSVIHISAVIETENAIQYMHSVLAALKKNGIHSPEWKDLYKHVDADIDISEQVMNLLHVCGNVCDGNSSEFRYINKLCSQNCSCDRYCAELSNCCPDVIIKQRPYNCFEKHHFPTWKPHGIGVHHPESLRHSYLVIDTCAAQDNVSQKCMGNTSHDDILSHYPVRINSNVMYKNVYCLQCNTRSVRAYMDIEISCNSYLEFQLFADFDDLLQGLKQHCMVIFGSRGGKTRKRAYRNTSRTNTYLGRPEIRISPDIVPQQREDVVSAFIVHGNAMFTTCNQTKKWPNEDRGIRKLCEGEDKNVLALSEYRVNGFVYKNFACFICNPAVAEVDVTRAISSCNVTGAWTRSLDLLQQLDQPYLHNMADLCNRTDFHPVWLPFKNYFCSECNLPHLRTYSFPMSDQKSIDYIYQFSLSEEMLAELRSNGVVTGRYMNCTGGTYDVTQERCRPLFCSAHRVIVNDKCRPISTLRKDTYIVTLPLRPITGQRHHQGNSSCFSSIYKVTAEAKHFVNFTDIMHDIIQQMIVSAHSWRSIQCNISVESPCGRDNDTFYFTPESVLRFSYSFEAGGLNLSLIETSLLQLLSKTYTLFTNTTCELRLKAEQKQQQFDNRHVPESCTFVHVFDNSSFNSGNFVVVDDFFECPQMQFGVLEIERLWNYESFIFNTKATKIVGSTLHICLNVFQELWSAHELALARQKALLLFQTIAVCVSVAALLITFITYCAFRELRTLPGQNMMVLIVCLACAQCLDIIRERVPPFTVMCQIVGSFTHYFLLATFFSLNVCSFHVMRVFYSQTQTISSFDKRSKLFYKYVLYALGTPLIFVLQHVSFSVFRFPGYGFGYGPDCFISGIHMLFNFIAPSIILFVLNYIFFSVGFHTIRTTKQIAATNRQKRNDFVVCLKLLLLMGITWPFLVIELIFVPASPVSFVVYGLNSLQGLYIFIAYVCNRRVIALYKAALCSKLVVAHT